MKQTADAASAGRAAEMRRAFDASFALPPAQGSQDVEDLLAIRVAGDPYALRLREITGMVAGRLVVPVPAGTRDLLGLAGIRGGVVAVFALASILGYPQAPGPPRWMILCGADEPIALAFSDFEGHVRLPTSSIHAAPDTAAAGSHVTRQHVDQVAHTEAGARRLISVPLIVAAIHSRSGSQRAPKEQ